MDNFLRERVKRFPIIDKEASDKLEQLAFSQKEKLSERKKERLLNELNIIRETGTGNLFLFALDCREKLAGKIYFRGVFNDSYLAFVLGLTRVDALAYNLPFERFLCKCKNQIPPLTMVINKGDKGKLINALYATYGWERLGRCKKDENSYVISEKMLGEYCRDAKLKLHVSVGETVWREQILPLTVSAATANDLYVFEIVEDTISDSYRNPCERELYDFAIEWIAMRGTEYSVQPYFGAIDVQKILQFTENKCIYQEQFMQICTDIIGVDGNTAEQWRKDICIRRRIKTLDIKEIFKNSLGAEGVKLYEYLLNNAPYMVAKGYLLGELTNVHERGLE